MNKQNAKKPPKKPERPKRVNRAEYQPADQTPPSTPKKHKGKMKRVVSCAMMEEGRMHHRLRGGGPHRGSEDSSLEKHDFYRKAPKKRKSKKKLCELLLNVKAFVFQS